MLHLRKGKKEIARFKTTYEFAENTDLIAGLFGKQNLETIQTIAIGNAFAMAIYGTKLRLGNGYIIEKC